MFTINLTNVSFQFDGNNNLTALIPDTHNVKLSKGPVKIILFGSLFIDAQINEVLPSTDKTPQCTVKINFSLPLVF